MKKSRVIWGLWLVLAVIFCFVTDGVTGYLLLAVSIVLPLLSGIMLFAVRGKMDVQLTLAAYGEKGKAVTGKLLVKNRSFLPADRLRCRVCCENLLTGEKEYTNIPVAAPARSGVDTEFQLKSRHAGKVRISLKSMVWYDLFGLFRSRLSFRGEAMAVGMIAPNIFPMETQIAYGESTNMDSDEYSMKKAGYDPSETFAIREYQPGDRIRQIHWKLTEKFDNLMVRDYGLPIQNTILLLLETGYAQDKPDPDCMDALAEALLSVSQELASQQVVHSIGWQNHEENTFSCVEVETEEDLNLVLPELLGAVPGEDRMTVAEHYMENREQLEFAHMVVFTPGHEDSLGGLASQCIVTEVICGSEIAGYDQQDGVAMVGGGPDNLSEAIAYLEI